MQTVRIALNNPNYRNVLFNGYPPPSSPRATHEIFLILIHIPISHHHHQSGTIRYNQVQSGTIRYDNQDKIGFIPFSSLTGSSDLSCSKVVGLSLMREKLRPGTAFLIPSGMVWRLLTRKLAWNLEVASSATLASSSNLRDKALNMLNMWPSKKVKVQPKDLVCSARWSAIN